MTKTLNRKEKIWKYEPSKLSKLKNFDEPSRTMGVRSFKIQAFV